MRAVETSNCRPNILVLCRVSFIMSYCRWLFKGIFLCHCLIFFGWLCHSIKFQCTFNLKYSEPEKTTCVIVLNSQTWFALSVIAAFSRVWFCVTVRKPSISLKSYQLTWMNLKFTFNFMFYKEMFSFWCLPFSLLSVSSCFYETGSWSLNEQSFVFKGICIVNTLGQKLGNREKK